METWKKMLVLIVAAAIVLALVALLQPNQRPVQPSIPSLPNTTQNASIENSMQQPAVLQPQEGEIICSRKTCTTGPSNFKVCRAEGSGKDTRIVCSNYTVSRETCTEENYTYKGEKCP